MGREIGFLQAPPTALAQSCSRFRLDISLCSLVSLGLIPHIMGQISQPGVLTAFIVGQVISRSQ